MLACWSQAALNAQIDVFKLTSRKTKPSSDGRRPPAACCMNTMLSMLYASTSARSWACATRRKQANSQQHMTLMQSCCAVS